MRNKNFDGGLKVYIGNVHTYIHIYTDVYINISLNRRIHIYPYSHIHIL